MIKFDTHDLERVTQILNRRAEHMVENLVHLGIRSADSYAQAGGRHAHEHPEKISRYRYYRSSSGRRVRRVKHATGAQDARMIEHLAYKAFLDFFGPW